MPGGAGLEGLQGSRVGLSEEGSLVEESVWNKGPGAATSSPAARAVSSGPAAALGVVLDKLLTPLSQNGTRWFLTHPVTRPSSEGCLIV